MESKCNGDSECNVTAEYFLETPSVSYKDVTLIPDTTAPATTLNLRINFLRSLANEINLYFWTLRKLVNSGLIS